MPPVWVIVVSVIVGVLLLVAIYDITQRHHAILRNFPIIGHFRYWLESIGPELRQYIVTDNNEERPFSRDQRRWVYSSSKRENDYFGFGSDNEFETSPNYLIIRHSAFPLASPRKTDEAYDAHYRIPCAKELGAWRGRKHAFRPTSVVNISGMSFGSLSGPAVEALNRGAGIAGCLHNTGEGGVTPYHQHGGELIWQIGTGYFGCRDRAGRFDLTKFKEVVDANPIRAIEIKLSQGAKPGLGGMLPAKKVTAEIARIRLIQVGEDCYSPARHSAFSDVDSMLDFVETLAGETGLPVGIKSAVGQLEFWRELAEKMESGNRGVDYITVDGGEGGTGAAPLAFSDHVALPFKLAISRVYPILYEHGLHEKIVLAGSGKLGFPESALLAFALGCDMVHVGREAMMAIGCIQAQRCHTGHCPTGVATQNRWLMRGLDPRLKSARLANYVVNLRNELLRLSRACGVVHPALVSSERLEIIDGRFGTRSVTEVFGYEAGWGLPSDEDRQRLEHLMSGRPPEVPTEETMVQAR
ncbi:MAG: FMN-binding glutamate synthase family protein [Phycisphaerales bacterium]